VYTGLLVKCPYDDEGQNCPFSTIRQKGLYDAFKIWSRLSEEEKEKLINQHIHCSNHFSVPLKVSEDSVEIT